MAQVVNSRFLTVAQAEPNLNTGWQIRILDYKDMKSLVAIASEFASFSFTQELNGTGTGTITFDEDSPFWSDILDNGTSRRVILNNEYVFEAWENGVARFAWLAQTVTNTVTGEGEARSITIAGPGIAQVLSWAVINRPGWPQKPPLTDTFTDNDGKKHPIPRSHSPSDKLPAYLWQFPLKWPTMRMWYTVFTAAQRRGVIRFVSLMFGALKDSGGQDWQWIKTIDELATQNGYQPPELNESLLDFLNDCTGQDYSTWFGQRLEWIMHPGFKLDVRRRIGVDRSKSVRFFSGNILSDERTRDRDAIFNRVIAVDVDGDETIRLDARSVTAWNLREQRNETNKNVTDATLRGQLADRYIKQSKDEKDQWSITIAYDDPGRQPFRNFAVGDDIGVNDAYLGSTPTAVAGPTKYRVKAITVSLSADQTVPDCELTLQSLLDLQVDVLQKQITQLINNPRIVKIGNIKEISIPTAPKTKSTLVYDPATKKWVAEPVTDSTTDTGGTGTGGTGGTGRVFMQDTDPALDKGVTVRPGDFWLETYD